jgi:hypothetical protein
MFARASVGNRTKVPQNRLGGKRSPHKSASMSDLNVPKPSLHESFDESEDPSLIKSFGGHKGSVSSISLSRDLTKMASCANSDPNLFIWTFDPDLRGCKYFGHKVIRC